MAGKPGVLVRRGSELKKLAGLEEAGLALFGQLDRTI